MAFPTDTIRRAIAAHLADAGIVAPVLADDEVFPADETRPVAMWGKVRPTPDAAVVINIYNVITTRDKHNPDVYVQLLCRTGDEDDAATHALAEQIFDLLDDRSKFTMGGTVRVLLCVRKIHGVATVDKNGRYVRPESYLFTLNPIGDA
jgi:hypothetical protein